MQETEESASSFIPACHFSPRNVPLFFSDRHQEKTKNEKQTNSPLPAPTKENLLVFYYDNPDEYQKANKRIQAKGIKPVEPENPYWKGKSETYEDPDHWRIILFNGVYHP
ncbi:VOC family protein [Arcticibacter sp. MXS-1]|uniref:VOC family protein n=1 Tax=Arcticibacter sp. MXS-1 TaxID=3341726 RepID=UPI0035A8B4CF